MGNDKILKLFWTTTHAETRLVVHSLVCQPSQLKQVVQCYSTNVCTGHQGEVGIVEGINKSSNFKTLLLYYSMCIDGYKSLSPTVHTRVHYLTLG